MALVELATGYGSTQSQGYDITDFLDEIRSEIDDAVNYFETEIAPDLEDGLRYFNGEVDLPVTAGRSSVVSTQVRDAVRNLKPSILRVLTSTSSIVKYVPERVDVATVIAHQEAYVHQLFWKNNGYSTLRDAVDEALKMRFCPVKTWWQPVVPPTYASLTMLTLEEVSNIRQMPDVEILSVVPTDAPARGDAVMPLFDIELEQRHDNGKIVIEPTPVNEFFISKNATGTHDAKVHGQARSVTVSEAIELGIEWDDWLSLDNQNDHSGIDEARGTSQSSNEDVLKHTFLLTEAYVRIDLLDAGTDQLYCLLLGGGDRTLLHWYRETETPYDLCIPDPKAFTAYGSSIADLMMKSQDVMTSLLRSTVDNAQAANRPRLAGDPQKVNFDDLMNHAIDYPIRMRAGAQLQVVSVPSTLQGSLPLLQWLEEDNQNKIGITKAAQGLDPNALQSTDKDAVRNTIALSQGQVELLVRNIVHSLIIPMFRKLLRLSIQHLDRHQTIRMMGKTLPVDQILFDPNAYAEPNVGVGTADEQKRLSGLQFTLSNQLMMLEKLGMDNPFVTSAHVYNTLEDLTKAHGMHDVSRYYNLVTPDVEKQYVAQKQKEAAEALQSQKPMDPGMALLQVEQIKAGVEKFQIIARARTEAMKAQLDALKARAEDDRKRDEMAQNLQLGSAKISGDPGTKVDMDAINREQTKPRTYGGNGPTNAESVG